MARRSGLGEAGLAWLIPPAAAEAEDGEVALRDLPLTAIEPNPAQPRTQFDEESLGELAAFDPGAGCPATHPGPRGGDGDVPADRGGAALAGRPAGRPGHHPGDRPHDQRPPGDRAGPRREPSAPGPRPALEEEAAAFQQLIEDFGLTHDDVATRVGKSRSTVTNTVRLLQLPAAIQRYVAEGQLTAGHARALLGSPDRVFQEQLARQAVAEHWTVRETEDAVHDRSARRPRPTPYGLPRRRRCDRRACWSSSPCWPSTSTRG